MTVYLGALAVPHNPALGAILGYLGIYMPGLILKFALLPFYAKLREHKTTKCVSPMWASVFNAALTPLAG